MTADLDFRLLRITVDGVTHHPVPSHEATASFQDITGKTPFVVREDGTGYLKIEHDDVPTLLFTMSGGEAAVGMPLDQWATAFVEVPKEVLIAFLLQALTHDPERAALATPPRVVN